MKTIEDLVRESNLSVELLSMTPNAEKLIEKAGRTAYQSFDNIEKGSEKKFIRMLIKRGHESVLEHAKATFRIKGLSRSCSHQLVRHRLASFTQKSQRYVNESNFNVIIPNSIKENGVLLDKFLGFMDSIQNFYKELVYKNDIKREDARAILPNATETEIVITANFRELRHILKLRGSLEAQKEIRQIAIEIFKELRFYVYSIVSDMELKFNEKRNEHYIEVKI
jgi:thymidylate synthase (FAD)